MEDGLGRLTGVHSPAWFWGLGFRAADAVSAPELSLREGAARGM